MAEKSKNDMQTLMELRAQAISQIDVVSRFVISMTNRKSGIGEAEDFKRDLERKRRIAPTNPTTLFDELELYIETTEELLIRLHQYQDKCRVALIDIKEQIRSETETDAYVDLLEQFIDELEKNIKKCKKQEEMLFELNEIPTLLCALRKIYMSLSYEDRMVWERLLSEKHLEHFPIGRIGIESVEGAKEVDSHQDDGMKNKTDN